MTILENYHGRGIISTLHRKLFSCLMPNCEMSRSSQHDISCNLEIDEINGRIRKRNRVHLKVPTIADLRFYLVRIIRARETGSEL